MLGGRNDPGLAFDWTRLERRFLGLRRDAQEAATLFTEWTGPPAAVVTSRDTFNAKTRTERRRDGPTYHSEGGRAAPTSTWATEIQSAQARFQLLFPSPTRATVEAMVRDDLVAIGYFVTATSARAVLNAAVQCFRSHFLSGPRRTYFRTKVDRPHGQETWATIDPFVWSTEEETDGGGLSSADGQVTVVWIHEVAEHVRSARNRADPNHADYDGAMGWAMVRTVK